MSVRGEIYRQIESLRRMEPKAVYLDHESYVLLRQEVSAHESSSHGIFGLPIFLVTNTSALTTETHIFVRGE